MAYRLASCYEPADLLWGLASGHESTTLVSTVARRFRGFGCSKICSIVIYSTAAPNTSESFGPTTFPPLLPTACKLRATKDVCCECSGTSVTF